MEINIESKRHHDKTSRVRFLEYIALPYMSNVGLSVVTAIMVALY